MKTNDIIRNGMWDQNVVFAQILGMCPTMALTSSATNGLGMGLATTAVLLVSNMAVSSVRKVVTEQVRIPVFIIIIAAIVTLVDMSLNAWMHDLHKVLGLYIPLIVANCAILGRAEAFACKNTVVDSGIDGLFMGLGFTCALTSIGIVREIIGSGTLFSQASLLLGPHFAFLETRVIPNYGGTLMMILPPGGFLTLGLLLAVRKRIEMRRKVHGAVTANAQPSHCGA
jgi:Na+-translocating ferredoxin:NAD+ oxidoreductase subunit E